MILFSFSPPFCFNVGSLIDVVIIEVTEIVLFKFLDCSFVSLICGVYFFPFNSLKEKERLKQEKRDEKRLNKERKLEQRRLELEMAKELKKPNEDMCLADQKVITAT